MSGELVEVGFGEVHENVDFIFTPLEILDREGVYCNHLNPRPQTRLQNLPRKPTNTGWEERFRGSTFFRVSAPE